MPEEQLKSFHEQPTLKDFSGVSSPWPTWPPPPRPRPRQGPSKATKVLAIALASLLIVSGLGLLIYATTTQYSSALAMQRSVYLKGTADSRATAAREQQETDQPLATAQAQIVASATAQAQATATIQTAGDQATATATALGSLLTQDTSGKPSLDDPLNDNSLHYLWDVGYTDNNNTGCNFVNGGYEAQEAQKGFLLPCFAEATNFSSFVYRASLVIRTGNEGGLIFCGNKEKAQYYLFRVNQNGNYAFELYNGNAYVSLASGMSTAISSGLNQSNTLAVIARQGTFVLFINSTYVASVSDKTLGAGQIGVAASNTSLPTTVDFSHAQVWTLS